MTLNEAMKWLADRACTVVLKAGKPQVRPGANFDPTRLGKWPEVAAALAENRAEVLRRLGAGPPEPAHPPADPVREVKCRSCAALCYPGGGVTAADIWRHCGRGPAGGVWLWKRGDACPWMPKHPEVPVPAEGWPERGR